MEEAQEIQQLISTVVNSEGRGVDQHFNRYKSIVSRSKSTLAAGEAPLASNSSTEACS